MRPRVLMRGWDPPLMLMAAREPPGATRAEGPSDGDTEPDPTARKAFTAGSARRGAAAPSQSAEGREEPGAGMGAARR